MFTHVLMTRFNLATPGKELAIRTQPGWLAGRFDLFERYCLPSVAAQSGRDFRWIIFFDKDTPQAFKDRIEELRGVFPFVPYYTGLFPAEGWRNAIRDTFAPATPLLLTTRLDNDDALAADYVERLHAAVRANKEVPGSYNFRNGLIRRGGALYAIDHPSNAFFSWLEPVGPEMRTAPSILHMKIAEEGPVRQIGGAPGWMQVVHETNVSNKVRGRRVAPEVAEGRFPQGLTEELTPLSAPARMAENLTLAPIRAGRDALIRLRARF